MVVGEGVTESTAFGCVASCLARLGLELVRVSSTGGLASGTAVDTGWLFSVSTSASAGTGSATAVIFSAGSDGEILGGVGSTRLCFAGTSGSSALSGSVSSSARQQFKKAKNPPDLAFLALLVPSDVGGGGAWSFDSALTFFADLLLLLLPCRLRVMRLLFDPLRGLGGGSVVAVVVSAVVGVKDDAGCCPRAGTLRISGTVFSSLIPAFASERVHSIERG